MLELHIILTHEHATAVLGLDDVRVVQAFSQTNDIDPTLIYLVSIQWIGNSSSSFLLFN